MDDRRLWKGNGVVVMDINLVFEIHQPFRLHKYGVKKDEKNVYNRYFNDDFNKYIFQRVAQKCYWPATNILLDLVNALRHEKKKFKVSFSITGTWLEQAEKWDPDLIDLFKQFPKNNVEFLAETYYHSLSGLYNDNEEFIEQVKMQRETIKSLFGQKPVVMTNTELIYNNLIAKFAQEMGFKGIFTEGAPRILGWRSPNYLYRPPGNVADKIKIFLRNRQLTDDVGYRFGAKWWDQWPLTAEKYSSWLSAADGQIINLFMDYETLGEHQWEETGIFWFLKALPWKVIEHENLGFSLPRESVEKYNTVGEFNVYELNSISWADLEMDVSAWLGNKMQQIIFNELQKIRKDVLSTRDDDLIKVWRLLQTSDHLHNICTKWWGDGDVHQYFSYFDTPQQGFETITEILFDFKNMVDRHLIERGGGNA